MLEFIILNTSLCRDNISERIYWILNNISDYPNCSVCKNKFKPRFYGPKKGYVQIHCSGHCNQIREEFQKAKKQKYFDLHGVYHHMNNPEVTERMELDCLKRTGHRHHIGTPETRKKSQQSHFERTGFYFPAQDKVTLGKMGDTYFKNTGFRHNFGNPEVIQQIKEDRYERTGFYHPLENPENVQALKELIFLKYNVENVMYDDEIAYRCLKNSFRIKNLILPSGKEISFQGFEDVAILKLLETYHEDDIENSNTLIPKIWYNRNNSKHRYHPDIYIEKENLIIEVKSTYTIKIDPEKIELKKQACLDAGYNYEIWLCSKKEVLEIL